jgi:hypothetical protein
MTGDHEEYQGMSLILYLKGEDIHWIDFFAFTFAEFLIAQSNP